MRLNWKPVLISAIIIYMIEKRILFQNYHMKLAFQFNDLQFYMEGRVRAGRTHVTFLPSYTSLKRLRWVMTCSSSTWIFIF